MQYFFVARWYRYIRFFLAGQKTKRSRLTINTVEIILSLWKLFFSQNLEFIDKITQESRLICKEDPQELAINNCFIIWTDSVFKHGAYSLNPPGIHCEHSKYFSNTTV